MCLYHWEIGLKDVDGIANSVDPDQTAPLASALCARTCLSENLGSLRYSDTKNVAVMVPKFEKCGFTIQESLDVGYQKSPIINENFSPLTSNRLIHFHKN